MIDTSSRWDRLKSTLTAERDKCVSHLGSGGAPNFDAYKDQVGVIKGLKFALDEMDRISGKERQDSTQTEDTET